MAGFGGCGWAITPRQWCKLLLVGMQYACHFFFKGSHCVTGMGCLYLDVPPLASNCWDVFTLIRLLPHNSYVKEIHEHHVKKRTPTHTHSTAWLKYYHQRNREFSHHRRFHTLLSGRSLVFCIMDVRSLFMTVCSRLVVGVRCLLCVVCWVIYRRRQGVRVDMEGCTRAAWDVST